MIYAITEYIKNGIYSPSAFRTNNLAKLTEFPSGINQNTIDDFIASRQSSLDFLKKSDKFYQHQYIDVDDDRSIFLTIYEDYDGFVEINTNYKQSPEFTIYNILKNQILEALNLKFIERGYIERGEYDQLEFSSIMDIIDNNKLIEWPKVISYKLTI